MVYGVILKEGEKYYTDMAKILRALDGRYMDYNWLITDFEGAYKGKLELLEREYAFVTGDELFKLASHEKVYQWIWAVISGFDKSIPLEEILKYPLPYADGYKGFWHDPISIQHPLADVEIVAWDSSLTLFISKNKNLAELFHIGFPLSEDLIGSRIFTQRKIFEYLKSDEYRKFNDAVRMYKEPICPECGKGRIICPEGKIERPHCFVCNNNCGWLMNIDYADDAVE